VDGRWGEENWLDGTGSLRGTFNACINVGGTSTKVVLDGWRLQVILSME
jgi:hypothetical protein